MANSVDSSTEAGLREGMSSVMNHINTLSLNLGKVNAKTSNICNALQRMESQLEDVNVHVRWKDEEEIKRAAACIPQSAHRLCNATERLEIAVSALKEGIFPLMKSLVDAQRELAVQMATQANNFDLMTNTIMASNNLFNVRRSPVVVSPKPTSLNGQSEDSRAIDSKSPRGATSEAKESQNQKTPVAENSSDLTTRDESTKIGRKRKDSDHQRTPTGRSYTPSWERKSKSCEHGAGTSKRRKLKRDMCMGSTSTGYVWTSGDDEGSNSCEEDKRDWKQVRNIHRQQDKEQRWKNADTV